MSLIDNFEKMLESGQDNAMLRFTLGSAFLKMDKPQHAVEHLRKAVEHDPKYSAAWKALGKALTACADIQQALDAYTSGIAVAEEHGDKQAAKEMQVFKRRLEKQLPPAD